MDTSKDSLQLADVERMVDDSGALDGPLMSDLYLSSGDDTKPLTLLHPDHLAKQGADRLYSPNLWIYVDKGDPWPWNVELSYVDERTRIASGEVRELTVAGLPARLQEMTVESDVLSPRRSFILRIKGENEALIGAMGGWQPNWVVSVCDGCTGFGGNDRCESDLGDHRSAIRSRLSPSFWVTDHVPGSDAPPSRSGGEDDLVNGGAVLPLDESVDLRLEQICFVSTDWRSNTPGDVRLWGGARVFSIRSRDGGMR